MGTANLDVFGKTLQTTHIWLEPDKLPMRWDYDEFVSEVSKWLSDTRPVDPELAIQAVFTVLSRHLPRGLINKVQNALEGLRSVWQSVDEDAGFALRPTKNR